MSYKVKRYDITDGRLPIKIPKSHGLFVCPNCHLSSFDIYIIRTGKDLYALCPDCYDYEEVGEDEDEDEEE